MMKVRLKIFLFFVPVAQYQSEQMDIPACECCFAHFLLRRRGAGGAAKRCAEVSGHRVQGASTATKHGGVSCCDAETSTSVCALKLTLAGDSGTPSEARRARRFEHLQTVPTRNEPHLRLCRTAQGLSTPEADCTALAAVCRCLHARLRERASRSQVDVSAVQLF